MLSSVRKHLKKILKKYKIKPLKRLGQNFLVDRRVLQKIIEAAELKPEDVVLEVGPGIGNLTLELAKRVKKVVAIEKDQNLARILNNELGIRGIKNVKVIQGDVLRIPNSKFLIPNSYKVVANLPYYITSPVLRHFLETVDVKPQQMVLLVQKEVAQRIVSQPPKMSILAVSVQFYAKPEIIAYVSKKSFWPQPKVDSAIIKISDLRFKISDIDRGLFFKIVKAGFSQPRKQIINNFSKKLKIDKIKIGKWLLKNGVKPRQRAETLSIEDWLNLTKSSKIK